MFGFRLVSEGVDFYLQTPFSIILTASLTALSVLGLARSTVVPANFLAFLYGSVALISAAIVTFVVNNSYFPEIQAEQLLKYLMYPTVFLFCATYRWGESHMRFLLRTVLVVTLCDFAASIAQLVLHAGYREYGSTVDRAFGLTSHPLPFSYKIFCLMILVYCFRKYIGRKAFLAFFVLSFAALYLTLSRTGWIMVALWVVFILLRNQLPSVKIISVIVLTPLLIVLLYSTGRFDDLITLPQFVNQGQYVHFNFRTVHSSYEWRLIQWYALINLGFQSLWVGRGLGIAAMLNQFDRAAHNSFIDFFVEGGVLGLISFVFFLTTVVIVARRCTRMRVEGLEHFKTFRATAHSLILGYVMAMGFAGSLFNNPLMMCLFFLVLGFICNIPFRRYLAERRSNRASRPRVTQAPMARMATS